jgi:hypothetical protein
MSSADLTGASQLPTSSPFGFPASWHTAFVESILYSHIMHVLHERYFNQLARQRRSPSHLPNFSTSIPSPSIASQLQNFLIPPCSMCPQPCALHHSADPQRTTDNLSNEIFNQLNVQPIQPGHFNDSVSEFHQDRQRIQRSCQQTTDNGLLNRSFLIRLRYNPFHICILYTFCTDVLFFGFR